MAVRLADYSKKHAHTMRAWWFGAIVLSTGAFVVMVYLASGNLADALLVATPVAVLQILTTLVLLHFTLEPLDILSRAITQVSGQANDVIPPNLNGTRHAKTALKDMVDTIYRLATGIDVAPHQTTLDETRIKTMIGLIEDFPFGIVGLDIKGKVLYGNRAAPLAAGESGDKIVKLMFEGEDSLEKWLESAPTRGIGELKTWPRVQNVLPGEPDRQVYDVFAQYNGGNTNGIDVLLVSIDRTKHYVQSEDDMDFISLAAHELRGPITVIHGYLDVLQDELRPHLKADQVALFQRLKVSAARLTGYINNILNVARYDRRHLDLTLLEDKLSTVYALIHEDYELRASTQNRLLHVTIPEDLPTIAADRTSLSEVLGNLIDNAIKYSHDGGIIEVAAAVDGDFVKCSVKDHGIGMPATVVKNLFSKFYRSHRSRQEFAGTGLGLYISKAILESHGGSIGVRSTEGEGSVFTFSVPIYATVKDKLLAHNNSNESIISNGRGWIKNHAMREG